MKNKILRSILIILFLSISMFVTIYFTAQKNVKAASITSNGVTAIRIKDRTLSKGEKNPDFYNYNIDCGSFDALKRTANSFLEPTLPGYQIYCLHPGSAIQYGDRKHTVEQLKAIYDNGRKVGMSTCIWEYGCDIEYKDSKPRYTPDGEYTLPVAMAYIISDNPTGKWTTSKARAIWNLRKVYVSTYDNDGKVTGITRGDDYLIRDGISEYDGWSSYDSEARDYCEYDHKIRPNGINLKDKTDLNSLYANVDQRTGEYTVGPFKMEYTNCIYGNIAFGGIKELTVMGYDKHDRQVRDSIPIEKIMLKSEYGNYLQDLTEPRYFTANEMKIDQAKNQKYPKSGQEFYIVFKDPNVGLSQDNPNRVGAIGIKVKFQYMLANGKYTKLKGEIAYSAWNHDHSLYPHFHDVCIAGDGEGGCAASIIVPDSGCRATSYVGYFYQQDLMCADAIRSLYEEEFVIGLKLPPDGTIGGIEGNRPRRKRSTNRYNNGFRWQCMGRCI